MSFGNEFKYNGCLIKINGVNLEIVVEDLRNIFPNRRIFELSEDEYDQLWEALCEMDINPKGRP